MYVSVKRNGTRKYVRNTAVEVTGLSTRILIHENVGLIPVDGVDACLL
jgi:hypothetical protein